MRTPALPSPRRIAVGAGLAVLAAGLTPVAASANAGGTDLVITEVYGGGGNGGADLHATTSSSSTTRPVPPSASTGHGRSQYRAATGTGGTGGHLRSPAPMPAGGHYLVQEAAGATARPRRCPTPDATGTLAHERHRRLGAPGDNARRRGGRTSSANAPTSPPTTVDMVGFGTAATRSSTAAPASRSPSPLGNAAGADTDNNAADFTVGAPDAAELRARLLRWSSRPRRPAPSPRRSASRSPPSRSRPPTARLRTRGRPPASRPA